jgi:hypothetical protein
MNELRPFRSPTWRNVSFTSIGMLVAAAFTSTLRPQMEFPAG